MPQTPSATATFLFTDIEGSTQLLKTHRAEYPKLLEEHHRVLREAFAAYGGREIDNQGDAFFVAFTRARDAVLAAAAAQRALAEHEWPGGAEVRVRMGIHTGEAHVTTDRYVGMAVHRAARISAVGHGGQVLVSQATASLIEDDEDDLPGIALRDLGEHRLKDIARPVRLYQLDVGGLPSRFPPLKIPRAPEQNRRKRIAFVAGLLLVAAVAAAVVALTARDAAPPEVVPNSLIRLDATTLEPSAVTPIGTGADLVVAAGGFVWITHHILRDIGPAGLRNAGDRTLTRVDPETGETVIVGGGLAPCGIAADPSGDVWVANCFAGGTGSSNAVRIDATSLRFDATWPLPSTEHFYRGLAYGGGSLWVADPNVAGITRLDPQTGRQRSIKIPRTANALAWSEGYGELWITNFENRSVTRIGASLQRVETIYVPVVNPAPILVDRDVVWSGDWAGARLTRLRAVGRPTPRYVRLPARNVDAGVWSVAAGGGYIWAATPRDNAVWKVDVNTNEATRIPLPYPPTGVATFGGDVWVVVRQ